MEMGYSPSETIERLCKHHHTTPTRLLTALMKALGRWRLHGWNAFPDIKPMPGPNGELPEPNIYAEIHTLMHEQEPPLDPDKCAVGSIMDAVMMCVNYDKWLHERSRDELDAAERGELKLTDSDWMANTLEAQHADDEGVLMLVMKECFNQLEAIKLEMALERDGAG